MTAIYEIILAFLMLLQAGADAFQARMASATCIALWGITSLLILVIIGIVLVARDSKRGSK